MPPPLHASSPSSPPFFQPCLPLLSPPLPLGRLHERGWWMGGVLATNALLWLANQSGYTFSYECSFLISHMQLIPPAVGKAGSQKQPQGQKKGQPNIVQMTEPSYSIPWYTAVEVSRFCRTLILHWESGLQSPPHGPNRSPKFKLWSSCNTPKLGFIQAWELMIDHI